MKTFVEVRSLPPRPSLVLGCIDLLTGALQMVPPEFRDQAILSVEADGTWRVGYYRDVSGAEKLAEFVKANPDVTQDDLQTAAIVKGVP